jgi:hypothetical protein
MKKISKIMLSIAAATVVTAAMAATAMAEETITGTYDNETGVVTMDGVIGSGKSQTLLVLNNVAEDVQSEDIAYINQIDNNGTFSTFTLASGLISSAPSTYYIKVGGTDGSLQEGTLTIAANTVTIVIGDATGDGKVNATDIQRIGRKVAGKTTGTGNTGQIKTKPDGTTVVIGDATGDAKVNATDIQRIGRKVAGKTTGTGNTGQEVEVLAD